MEGLSRHYLLIQETHDISGYAGWGTCKNLCLAKYL